MSLGRPSLSCESSTRRRPGSSTSASSALRSIGNTGSRLTFRFTCKYPETDACFISPSTTETAVLARPVDTGDLEGFHAELNSKQYKYARPGIEDQPWGRDM